MDDVTGGDITRRGNDVIGKKEENDIIMDDVAEMAMQGTRMSRVREIT